MLEQLKQIGVWWNKQEASLRFALVIGSTSISMILYILGKAFGDFKGGAGLWIMAALGELGGVIVAAAVSGVILKIMAMQGYFQSALAEIVLSDKALDQIEQDRRIYLWRRLTQRIYMPGLSEKLAAAPDHAALNMLRDKLATAVAKRFSYDKRAYIEEMRIVFTIEWVDHSRSKIIKKERLRFTHVPFYPDLPSEWEVIRTAEPQVGLAGYSRDIVSFKINGQDPPKPEINNDVANRQILKYPLVGAEKYTIVEEEHIAWNLDSDPSWIRNLSLVTQKLEIEVVNEAEGLLISLIEIGGDGQLKVVEGEPDIIQYKHRTVRASVDLMLPDQGIQMIFTREAPNRTSSPADKVSRG